MPGRQAARPSEEHHAQCRNSGRAHDGRSSGPTLELLDAPVEIDEDRIESDQQEQTAYGAGKP